MNGLWCLQLQPSKFIDQPKDAAHALLRHHRPPARDRRRRPDRPGRRRARSVARPAHRRPREPAPDRRRGPRVGPRPPVLGLERAGRPCRRSTARRHRLEPTRPERRTRPAASGSDAYLAPLAAALDATDEVEVRYDHRVVGVAKQGRDRMVDSGREDAAVHRARADREPAPAADRRRRHRRLRHLVRRQPARRRRPARARRGRARRPHHLRHPRLHRPRHSRTGTPASASPSPAAAPRLRTPSSD